MKLGACIPNYGETCSKEALVAIAAEAESCGYDSVWATDHILMSKNSGTPYERIFDSIATLSYLAGKTERVRLGISSLITPMRNPVIVAKQLATIDNLSDGRLILATSVGWNETEFSNLGSNFHDRGRRLDASIHLLRDLWSGKTSFENNKLPQHFHDAVFEPHPVQRKLTVWIGGTSPAAMRRAIREGDAWHPNLQPLDKFEKQVSDFRALPSARGRDICVRIGLNINATKSEYLSPLGEKRIMLSSNQRENSNILERLESLGVKYAVVVPSPDGKVSVEDQAKGLQMIAREFM
ncbi:MAG: LLM class F420-dependent oxidoreductase [Chloroflexi bacterium]|nr:MAG: LLM class F420-dependent oxidoreductase [Chloroflexota bacterium]